jgi:ABC-type transport system involved in cytochrome c biogenesis permease subunit
LLHLSAIAARVYILDRAPVGTLYESILFVGLICVLVSVVLEQIRKDGQAALMGAIAALLLLFTAGSFAEGDTMKMLVAVLNTNFWLSTHVLCITMGYGWCVMASLIAHGWMIRKAMGRETLGLAAAARIIAVIALLFTAVGTILGGIWADQSWGRFWGWDPKENGALLIVLWLAWVFHGQIGGHMKLPALMAGLAALSVIVGIAWFGVNLLSVGLHSYGFISGVAAGLATFCAAEIALIGFLWLRIQRGRV